MVWISGSAWTKSQNGLVDLWADNPLALVRATLECDCTNIISDPQSSSPKPQLQASFVVSWGNSRMEGRAKANPTPSLCQLEAIRSPVVLIVGQANQSVATHHPALAWDAPCASFFSIVGGSGLLRRAEWQMVQRPIAKEGWGVSLVLVVDNLKVFAPNVRRKVDSDQPNRPHVLQWMGNGPLSAKVNIESMADG